MPLSEFEIKRIEKVVGDFIEQKRPPVQIRNELDLGYKVHNQSVEIFETRALWNNPKIENVRKSMAWIYLVVAGLFECGWAIGLKYTNGFTKPVPTFFTVSAMAISFWLLSAAMKTIPVGTAYSVWTGIGAVGVAILGMFLFGESRDVLRIMCLLLIVSGIVGLKLVSS